MIDIYITFICGYETGSREEMNEFHIPSESE